MGFASSFKATLDNLLQRNITERLQVAGTAWLARSRALAPVRTGRLRDEEDFIVEGNRLRLILGAPYDIFQEFGTRYIRPHPHVRPALNEIGRIFGAHITMDFNTMSSAAWQGVYHHKGQYIVPSAIQPKPLTAKQRAHVAKHLVPSGKQHYKGNVKRAQMRVRKHY